MKVFYAPLIVAALLAQCTVFADECVDTTATGSSTTQTSTSTSTTTATTSTTASTVASIESSASVDSGESLAVVEPIIACSDLLSVDLTSIGGSGTNITEATETEVDGVSYCYVEGYLPTRGRSAICRLAAAGCAVQRSSPCRSPLPKAPTSTRMVTS